MADPWAEFRVQSPPQAAESDPWAEFRTSDAPKPDKSYTGTILPFSIDPEGRAHFDSDAGILGSIKRAITLPREVYEGKVDLNNEARHWSEPDPTMERVLEAATVVSPANPAARIGDRAIPGPLQAARREAVSPPTAEELKAASRAGYDQVRDMGVDYSSNSVRELARSIQADLEKDGVLSELAPKSFKILQRLQEPPAGSVAPLSGIEAARRSFGNAAKDFANPTEQLAATRIMEALDSFVAKPNPASVVAGPAAEAASIQQAARGNYAAAKRSEKLTGIEEAAELRAAAANSGQNIDNATRQRIASLLLNPKAIAGFSKEEIAALEAVARGTRTGNTARAVGNMLGGGGGLGGAFTSVAGAAGAGYATGSPSLAALGALLPVAGYGAKKVATSSTRRAFTKADEMTRMRSPLYEDMVKNAPLAALNPEYRSAAVRALLLAQGIDPDL